MLDLAHAGVGVQAGHPEVDADHVEQQAAEADQLDEGGASAAPSAGGAGVEVAGVDDPGDERPGLLGVPAPVPAPGVVGPDGAGDDPERPDREGEQDRPVGQPVQHGGAGQVDHQALGPGGQAGGQAPLVAVRDQVHDVDDGADQEQADGDDHRGDVDGDPVGVQRGDQAAGRGVHEGDVDGQGQDDREQDEQVDVVGPELHRDG